MIKGLTAEEKVATATEKFQSEEGRKSGKRDEYSRHKDDNCSVLLDAT